MKTHFDDVEELKDVPLSREDTLLILHKLRKALTAKYVRAALRISIRDLTTTIENGDYAPRDESRGMTLRRMDESLSM